MSSDRSAPKSSNPFSFESYTDEDEERDKAAAKQRKQDLVQLDVRLRCLRGGPRYALIDLYSCRMSESSKTSSLPSATRRFGCVSNLLEDIC